MIRTQIYFSPRQIGSLKKKAFATRLSVSELIRRIVEKEISEAEEKKIGKRNVGSWLASIALEAKKMKVQGPSDLASNIDKYLYGDSK